MKLSALFSLVLAAVAIAAPHGRRAEGSGAEHDTGATTNTTEPATGGEVFRPAPPGALAPGSRPIQLDEIKG
jgi:hypothetical protein